MRGKRGSDRDGLLHGLAAEAWSELSRAVVIERLCDRLLDSEAGAEVGELLRAIRGLARRLEDWRLELWLQLVLLTDRPVRKREQLDLAGFLRGLAQELAAEYPDVTFDLPQELPVVGEGRLLMFLFILLFQAAVELGGEGTQLSLRWGRTRKYYWYRLRCTWVRGGHPLAESCQLFRLADGMRRQGRLGRRLALCREIIRCHGGRLWLREQADPEVVFELPAGQLCRQRRVFAGAILGRAPKIR